MNAKQIRKESTAKAGVVELEDTMLLLQVAIKEQPIVEHLRTCLLAGDTLEEAVADVALRALKR